MRQNLKSKTAGFNISDFAKKANLATIIQKNFRQTLVLMQNSALQEKFNSGGNSYIPCLLQIITFRFTYDERKMCSTIKKSKNIMNIIVA